MRTTPQLNNEEMQEQRKPGYSAEMYASRRKRIRCRTSSINVIVKLRGLCNEAAKDDYVKEGDMEEKT